MKAGITTSVHNRFDIYTTNTETGITAQIAYAENIILDQMWTRLTARAAYFVNIHYGTGIGTPAASRTGLFAHLATKAAVDDILTRTLPTASWRRKIVLAPEDNVGATITELGISYDATASHLVTHALLKDMNGNTVAITKTAVDVLTIYATVYITFSTSDTGVQICGLPNNNPLMNYLVGGAAIAACYFYTGTSRFKTVPQTIGIVEKSVLGTTSAVTWTADVPNKKMSTSTPRLAVGDSNGHVREIVFGTSVVTPIFRISLPTTSVYQGLPLAGIPIATGDGVSKKFNTPSKNVNNSTLSVYIDGILATGYTLGLGSDRAAYSLRQLFSSGYEDIYGVAFSKDAKICAMTTQSSPFLSTFDILENVAFIKREMTTPFPTEFGVAKRLALSADGLVLAVTHTASPFISAYDWSGSAWIKRADPSVLPTSAGNTCSLSDDGLVLAVAHTTSPFISTYDWSGSAWIKRSDPFVLPTGAGNACSLSNDGLVLAVAHTTSPFISTYDWSGATWVKRNNPDVLPTGAGMGCALAVNNMLLAVSHTTSPFISTYDWSGSAWIKRNNPAVLPARNGSICSLSVDGTILAIIEPYYRSENNIENACWYLWDDNVWTKQALINDWNIDPFGKLNDVAITQDGQFMFIAGDGEYSSSGGQLVDMGATSTCIIFNNAPATGAVITADYIVDGIHKTIQRVIDFNATITFGEPT